MIKFIQKLIILWEKKKFLTLLELEQAFLLATYPELINRDLTQLRGRLSKLNAKDKKTSKEEIEVIDINGKINETEKYKQMITNGQLKEKELKIQISMYKKLLWRL